MHFCFLDPAFSIFKINTWFRERKHVVVHLKYRESFESEKTSGFDLIVGVQNKACKACFRFCPLNLKSLELLKTHNISVSTAKN